MGLTGDIGGVSSPGARTGRANCGGPRCGGGGGGGGGGTALDEALELLPNHICNNRSGGGTLGGCGAKSWIKYSS